MIPVKVSTGGGVWLREADVPHGSSHWRTWGGKAGTRWQAKSKLPSSCIHNRTWYLCGPVGM
jgi:hypothetical protein